MQDKLKHEQQEMEPKPMLATLTDERFSDDQWIYERKLDGERCMLIKKDGGIRILSRNMLEQNAFYPEICEALKEFSGNFILDGELVVFDGKTTSFSKLQNRMHKKNPDNALLKKYPVILYIFDIIYLDGYNLKALPLRKRKGVLKAAFNFHSPIRFLPHRNKEGEKYFKQACQKNWEGIIAKRADSQYVSTRSKQWLKFKCHHQQEFVICGYTEPQGERTGFGALLLGYYEQEKLKFAGRVGTGFDEDWLEDLHNKMKKRRKDDSPIEQYDETEKNITWIEPELVAEVAFTEWTKNNRLRHPAFLGLRKDKNARDVHKEKADAS